MMGFGGMGRKVEYHLFFHSTLSYFIGNPFVIQFYAVQL